MTTATTEPTTRRRQKPAYEVSRQAVNIPLTEITRGDNDRTVFDQAELQELADDIKRNGLDTPITVRPIQPRDGGGTLIKFEIVAGERRYRACLMAGLSHIPAIVRELDDEQAARIMFAENIKRKDIDVLDEANVYHKWQSKLGWDLDRSAAEAGKSKDHIRGRLALLELLPEIQLLVRKKTMPLQHAEAMLRIRGADGELASLNGHSQSLAIKALGNADRMPAIADWRQLCGELLANQQQSVMFDMDAWTVAIEAGTKKAKSAGLKRHPAMPKLVANKNTGHSLKAYIETLEAAGLHAEALAVSHVLAELVDGNLTSI